MKVIDMAVHEVATITADKTICDCARQMRLEHVGSLVVVNDDQTPLGMITDRDIAIEVVARNLDPMKLTVRDVMTTPVVTAGPSESMVVALARMREFGVRRLPIVDEEGKLVGVISNSPRCSTAWCATFTPRRLEKSPFALTNDVPVEHHRR